MTKKHFQRLAEIWGRFLFQNEPHDSDAFKAARTLQEEVMYFCREENALFNSERFEDAVQAAREEAGEEARLDARRLAVLKAGPSPARVLKSVGLEAAAKLYGITEED